MSNPRPSPLCPQLTIRQVEVVQLVARGLGTKEIAKQLKISITGARNQISHIYEKLEEFGIFSREQLTTWALQKKLVQLDGIEHKRPAISLPARTHVVEMQHKYSVGDKVRVKYYRFVNSAEGEITALLPYRFVAPAYDVKVNGVTIAVSERSIERIEV